MKLKLIFLLVIILLIQLIVPTFCQVNDSNTSLGNSIIDNSNFSIWNTLSFLFGLFGVVGTIYSIYSYRIDKKDKEVNRVIIEAAAKSLDKKAIENEIEHMKKQQDNYAKKNKIYEENIKLLREQIETDIPNEAKKAVLKGKLLSQQELLIQTYDSLLAIKKELSEIGNDFQISPEIQKMVEKEIRPEYALREEQSRVKSQLLILTTGATISSSVLPYPFNKIATFLLLAVAINPFIKMTKSQLTDYSTINLKNLVNYPYLGYFALAFIIIIAFGSMELFYFLDYGIIDYDMFSFIALLLLIYGLVSFYVHKKFHK